MTSIEMGAWEKHDTLQSLEEQTDRLSVPEIVSGPMGRAVEITLDEGITMPGEIRPVLTPVKRAGLNPEKEGAPPLIPVIELALPEMPPGLVNESLPLKLRYLRTDRGFGLGLTSGNNAFRFRKLTLLEGARSIDPVEVKPLDDGLGIVGHFRPEDLVASGFRSGDLDNTTPADLMGFGEMERLAQISPEEAQRVTYLPRGTEKREGTPGQEAIVQGSLRVLNTRPGEDPEPFRLRGVIDNQAVWVEKKIHNPRWGKADVDLVANVSPIRNNTLTALLPDGNKVRILNVQPAQLKKRAPALKISFELL